MRYSTNRMARQRDGETRAKDTLNKIFGWESGKSWKVCNENGERRESEGVE
jgi:hypothetical protein